MIEKIIVLSVALIALTVAGASAAALEGYRFVKISAEDQKAVVKSPEGEMTLVGPGDSIGDAKVTEITGGRVVLEREGEGAVETLIVHLEDGRQKVDRMKVQPLRKSTFPEPAER